MEYVKGRGATANRASERFGLPERESDDEWREQAETLDGPPAAVRTAVTELHPKTILSFNASPDIFFDRSINAYNGCEHGPDLLWLTTMLCPLMANH